MVTGVSFDTGRGIVIQVNGNGQDDGQMSVRYCVEAGKGILSDANKDVNCLQTEDGEQDKLHEGELFTNILGIDRWEDIGDIDKNLPSWNAAAAFSQYLIAMERFTDVKSVDVKRLLNLYELALTARGNINAKLKDAPRWNAVQWRVYEILKEKYYEVQKIHDEDKVNEVKDQIKHCAELLHGEYGSYGSKEVEVALGNLIWSFATGAEKFQLCKDEDCRKRFQFSAEEARQREFLRISPTSKIYRDPPRMIRNPILTVAMGPALNMRDAINNPKFRPGFEASLTVQPIEPIRLTGGAMVTYDEGATRFYSQNGTPYLYIDRALIVSPYAFLGFTPWGRYFCVNLGVKGQIYNGTRTIAREMPDGNPIFVSKGDISQSDVSLAGGIEAYFTESIGARVDMVTSDPGNTIVTYVLTLRHDVL